MYISSRDEDQFRYLEDANIEIKKGNVLYSGIYNLLDISFPDTIYEYHVGCEKSDCEVYLHEGSYIVEVFSIGEINIIISNQEAQRKFPFKVERIPTPVPSFHPRKIESGGKMKATSFKHRRGIFAVLENFDYEVKCKIQGYDLIRVDSKEKEERVSNSEAVYSPAGFQLIKKAKPGDIFIYDNIKVKCPGDKTSRTIATMSWNME